MDSILTSKIDSLVSIRFSFNENPSQVFKQPLFYLAENIKQYIHLSLKQDKYNGHILKLISYISFLYHYFFSIFT